MKLLFQSPEEFSSVIWNFVIKTSRIRNVLFIFQKSKIFLKPKGKLKKNDVDFEKSPNSFETRKKG